jgi:hypothetical protein
MPSLCNVSWGECIQALRRAGFVQAAESPSNVMLVSAGRTVLLQRVAIFEEPVLMAALRAAGLSRSTFLSLLPEGVAQVVAPDHDVA